MTVGDSGRARIVGGDIDRRDIIRLLDEEFVIRRNRSGSLSQRYPDIFDDPQSHLQVVLSETGKLAAACCCKRFAWRSTNGRHIQGGMIGLVTSAPAYRGEGFGQRVVENAVTALKAAGAEVATLWTSIPTFYAKLGWRGGVSGAYGTIANAPEVRGESRSLRWTASPFDMAAVARVETKRATSTGTQVLRESVTYRKLPGSTERLWLGEGPEAYVLLGEQARNAVIYEIEGQEVEALALLDVASRRWPGLMANDRPGGIVAMRKGFGDSNLAMWMPLRTDLPDEETWFVPYFDRI